MSVFPFRSGLTEGVVANDDAPTITFIKKNGRLRLKGNGKDIAGESILNEQLKTMTSLVKHAQRGERIVLKKEEFRADGGSSLVAFSKAGVQSTFPGFFGDLGFSSRKQFLNVMKKREGKKFNQVVNRAIEDLTEGSSTSFGRIPPDEEFLIKTRQVFDNRNIVFRVIGGKVRPIRSTFDDVPF